jgi:hypothetical protein
MRQKPIFNAEDTGVKEVKKEGVFVASTNSFLYSLFSPNRPRYLSITLAFLDILSSVWAGLSFR